MSTNGSQQSSGSSGNPQSPVGSPPLILAFLAIGIFSAAMIAVFGWRRVQFGRETGLWGYTDTTGNPGRRGMRGPDPTGLACSKFGEKPVLWEVWVDRNKKIEGRENRSWDNSMPLAVLPTPHDNPSASGRVLSLKCSPSSSPLPSSPESPSIFPLPQTSQSQRRQRLDETGPMSIFRRNLHITATPNGQSNSIDQGNSGENEQGEEKDAQIVMIIEMPSPANPRYRHAQGSGPKRRSSHYSSLSTSETLVDNTGRMREDLLGIYHDNGRFQYCIGVHTCPWPLSGTSPAKNDNRAERITHSHSERELG